MRKAELFDPRSRGPKPPFPQPPQVAPGRDDQMQPPADHGEKDYEGRGRLKDRVALITGGDSGIGRAVALLYAQEGARVVITCLEDDAADGRVAVETIAKLGGTALCIPGDVRNPVFCRRLVERTVSEYGSLDILVNNSGFQRHHEKLAEFTADEIDATFRTNVFATIYLTQAAEPHLRPGRLGSMAAVVQLAALDLVGLRDLDRHMGLSRPPPSGCFRPRASGRRPR